MTIDERHRQTDHVLIAPIDGRNELRCEALDGVRTGFVAWLPAPSVPLNLFLRHFEEGNPGTGDVNYLSALRDKADSGVDPMAPAGESAEHPGGIFVILRLAQDVAVETDLGIRAQD